MIINYKILYPFLVKHSIFFTKRKIIIFLNIITENAFILS